MTMAAVSKAKPTIVLIPGGWHSPVHFDLLTAQLRQAGYDVTSLALPSVDPENASVHTVVTDAAFIRRKLLLPLLEEQKDVLLVMHSYGGCPGSAAAKGLSRRERLAARQAGGIFGLAYISAFLANEGDSLFSSLGGKWDTWVVVDVGDKTHNSLPQCCTPEIA